MKCSLHYTLSDAIQSLSFFTNFDKSTVDKFPLVF